MRSAPVAAIVTTSLLHLIPALAEASAVAPENEPSPAEAPSAPTPPEGTRVEEPPPAPFAFADFSWMPGNAGATERPLSFGPFTGEFRADSVYHYSFSHPKDDTLSGS